jgi:hypothetical protein
MNQGGILDVMGDFDTSCWSGIFSRFILTKNHVSANLAGTKEVRDIPDVMGDLSTGRPSGDTNDYSLGSGVESGNIKIIGRLRVKS